MGGNDIGTSDSQMGGHVVASPSIRVLNVAEKHSVAESISRILVGEGYKYRCSSTKAFEFTYKIKEDKCDMFFTSVNGHLLELDFNDHETGNSKRWGPCKAEFLFEAKIEPRLLDKCTSIKNTLVAEAKNSKWLILWLDNDSEGENIASEVANICEQVNKDIKVFRARFNSLNATDILKAVNSLGSLDRDISDSVDVRREIDLRVGAPFTRYQTKTLKYAFKYNLSTDVDPVFTFGLCQFPTLGFLVERQKEIQAYDSQNFWDIHCSHTIDNDTTKFNLKRGGLFDYSSAKLVYDLCVKKGCARVRDVSTAPKSSYPPDPLTTVELEKRASKYYNISSDRTNEIAEALYQDELISYPRTGTNEFSKNLDLKEFIEHQAGHPKWGGHAKKLLSSKLWDRRGSDRPTNDGAHDPIHPIKLVILENESRWTQDHRNVYELVCRHFLASVSPAAQVLEKTVELEIAGQIFSTLGRERVDGTSYLDVYKYESRGTFQTLKYELNKEIRPVFTLTSGPTRPPKLFTEVELLNRMHEASIGTDATRHKHIKNLLLRSYAVRDGSCLKPTDLGLGLVLAYERMGLDCKPWLPELRQEMEQDLRKICSQQVSKEEVLEKYKDMMKKCFMQVKNNEVKFFETLSLFFDKNDANRNYGTDRETARAFEGMTDLAANVQRLLNYAECQGDKLESCEDWLRKICDKLELSSQTRNDGQSQT